MISIGCPKFFQYHPGADIFDYMERFNIESYDQAVKEIKSFELGKETETQIFGYTPENETGVSTPPQDIFGADLSETLIEHTTHHGLRNEYDHSTPENKLVGKTKGYEPKERGKIDDILNDYLSLARKIFYISKRLYKFVNRYYKDSSEEDMGIEKTIDLLYQYVRRRLVYHLSVLKEEEEEFKDIPRTAKEKKGITLEEIEKILLGMKRKIRVNETKSDRIIDDLFESEFLENKIGDFEMTLRDFQIPEVGKIKA